MLAAYDRAVQQDPYDNSKMEFKSPAALITGERHTGSFATGDSLSMDATLKPLNAAQLKEVHLDTTHRIIEIAPGVHNSGGRFVHHGRSSFRQRIQGADGIISTVA
ncbi:MAG: hypothetical protein ACXWCS_09550 [Burkholderiales bacterium]